MAADELPQAATPEEIRAILREVAASQRETDRRMQETDQLLKRQGAETDRRMQETDRRIRELNELFTGQWGKLMEALVDGDLIELLNRRNIDVHHTMTNVTRDRGRRLVEIDILAVNGREVVAVEVKSTLRVRDVDHFLGMLEHFTELLPEYQGRKVYGAVAWLRAQEWADRYAARRGLFVIRATGSSASITNREDFTPRVFGTEVPR